MQEGDLNGLLSQNAYLKEALDTCISDIASMSLQASQHHCILLWGSLSNLAGMQVRCWPKLRHLMPL
jgi:hypothetical protein